MAPACMLVPCAQYRQIMLNHGTRWIHRAIALTFGCNRVPGIRGLLTLMCWLRCGTYPRRSGGLTNTRTDAHLSCSPRWTSSPKRRLALRGRLGSYACSEVILTPVNPWRWAASKRYCLRAVIGLRHSDRTDLMEAPPCLCCRVHGSLVLDIDGP